MWIEARDDTGAQPHVPAAVQSEQCRLLVPSRPEWITPTAEYLQRRAVFSGVCLEAQGSRLLVALHEALSNSIIHGNLEVSSQLKEREDNSFTETLTTRAADPYFSGRTVDVFVSYDGSCCRWVLTDQGPGFDVQRVLGRDDGDGFLASGRGILMMRAFLDDVRYEAGGRRVILTLARPQAQEKRLSIRQPLQEQIQVTPFRPDGSVDWEAAYTAVTRNLSAGGLAILQAGLATTGRVLLTIPAGDQAVYLPAEVRHWRTVGDNEVEVGCCFQAAPATPAVPVTDGPAGDVEEAVAQLCERCSQRHTVQPERRLHPRVPYTERLTILDSTGKETLCGFGRDLSKGGIAFLTTAPLPLETRVLCLPQGVGQESMRVRVRILRCARIMDGFYDVAGRFLSLAA